MTENKFDFNKLLESVCSCYGESVTKSLPRSSDFPDTVYDSNGLNENQTRVFLKSVKDIYVKSVCYRMMAVFRIQESREKKIKLDISEVWNLVYLSICDLPQGSVISSIGSQGFISIPLYRYRTDINEFEFIRLHIWDDSLNQYISSATRKDFSIHSHRFYAQSWVISGSILNERYHVEEVSTKKEHALFDIKYNETINKVNKHTSNAVNTKKHVELKFISKEQYFPSSTYQIQGGSYHKAGTISEDGLTATFFSFTAKDGIVDSSYVIGPSTIENSEINRKTEIDPSYLLRKLDSKIKSIQTEQKLMILDWMRKVHQLEYAHRYESIKWSKRHTRIGYPAFIISILIAFSFRFPWEAIATEYGEHFYTSHGFYIAMATSFVAILTGYQTFVRPNEKAVMHKNTGQHHERVRHQLEYILTTELGQRNRNSQLEEVRKEWEAIDAINVSNKNFKKGKVMVESFNKYPEELSFVKDRKNQS